MSYLKIHQLSAVDPSTGSPLTSGSFPVADGAGGFLPSGSLVTSVLLPHGTDGQRPTEQSTDRSIRFNDTSNLAEIWNGTVWIPIPKGTRFVLSPILLHTITPHRIVTLGPDQFIERIDVLVYVPFDGSGANLQVGTAGTPDRFLGLQDIEISESGTTSIFPCYKSTSVVEVFVNFAPGVAATTGEASLVLTIGM